ncbi:hypothetical protein Z043_119766, partial [Scleropages formosus]
MEGLLWFSNFSEPVLQTVERVMGEGAEERGKPGKGTERGRFSFSRSPSTLERQPRKPPRSAMEGGPALTPRKPSGSAMEPPSHQDLHREKPELQRVLEQRRLDQHREQEQALRPPSDLEQELRKRQQKLEEYEKEERKRREEQENVPEFVR